jgi:hypothetical protein
MSELNTVVIIHFTGTKLDLASYLNRDYWFVLIDVVKEMAANGKDGEALSLPLKIGHSINKIIDVEISSATQKREDWRLPELHAMEELMKRDWSDRVSTGFLRKAHDRKLNK